MSRDIAATIAAGYGVGRAIGNDIASSRFAKADAKLKKQIEERAAAKGVPVEDLFEEYVSGSRDLAQKKGVTRRGIEVGGKRLEDEAVDRYKTGVQEAGSRRGGALMAAGDVSGGARAIAMNRYKTGDVDQGMKVGQYADTVDATKAATNADGTIDTGKSAQGRATVAAKYGDAQGAEGAQSEALTNFTKAANMLYGRAATYMSAGTDEGNEQALGFINAALEQDPRWGSGLQARYDRANDTFGLYQGEQLVDYIPAKDAPQWMETFAQDPEAMLKSAAGARAADGAATREAQRAKDELVLKESLGLIRDLTKAGVDATTAQALTSSVQNANKAGWKFEGSPQASEDGSTWQLATMPNGQPVRIAFDTPANTETGDPGASVRIMDLNGQAVNPASIPGTESVTQYAQAYQSANRTANAAQVRDLVNFGLQAINAAAYGGAPSAGAGASQGATDGPTSRGGPRGKGAITLNAGKYKTPIAETTDYINKIMATTGEIPADASLDQKFQMLLPHLVQQESAGDPNAVSKKGAKGLMQVMDDTNRDPGFGVQPARDNSPAERQRVGEDYLRAMLERYNGDVPLTLAAYNAGPGRADAWAKNGGLSVGGGSGGGSGGGGSVPAGPPVKSGFLAGAPLPTSKGATPPPRGGVPAGQQAMQTPGFMERLGSALARMEKNAEPTPEARAEWSRQWDPNVKGPDLSDTLSQPFKDFGRGYGGAMGTPR